jgi:1,4-dihydroxy-2-naphthoate octaprenyltransferase
VADVRTWVQGARPRTLPAAVVPVLVGTAVAASEGRGGGAGADLGRAALALVVSLALQVGVNYANDYSDGVRGTDTVRVGPVRLVGQGLARPRQVKLAAFAAFGVAAVCGLVLALLTTPWLIAVGVAAIAAAWGYTGGPRPYGYAGLGEAFVFVFFGIVAVVGTVFVQREAVPVLAWVTSVPVGLLAVSLLVVNNLRDIPTDARSGKQTMAVRLGDVRTRVAYVSCVAMALAAVPVVALVAGRPWVLVGLGAAAAAVAPVRIVRSGATGRDLVPVLGATGRVQVLFGVLVAVGLVL